MISLYIIFYCLFDMFPIIFAVAPYCNTLIYPLVENSAFHGIFPKSDKGEIGVSLTREGDSVRVTVEDDGVGMGEEKLRALKNDIFDREIEALEHIGMRNVHSRLMLLLGAGLNIESAFGSGTRIWFELPYKTG